MQLDVRQESGRHTEAVADILAAALSLDYRAMDENQRLDLLSEAIAAPGGLMYDPAALSPSQPRNVGNVRSHGAHETGNRPGLLR